MKPDLVANFIQKVAQTYASGHAREHSYRPALKELFEQITELTVINEPKRSEFGAPDFVFLKGKVIVSYAEAKDINVSLDGIEKGEQMERYYGYSNIILTNGLDFRFYRNGTSQGNPIVVGKISGDTIEPLEAHFQLLEDTVRDFIKDSKEPIKSGAILSKVMAGKARRIRDNIKTFLAVEGDTARTKNENLLGVYEVIKKLLLPDLDHAKFADMYAQTLVYGLFVARYHDKTSDSFSRAEARDLVPPSNPFLRHFFDHIAGSSFDPRIEMIVNELCEEFTHADVGAIVHDYYKIDKDSSRDPIIHFYEDFLQEYDSAERKKMGVFYTPLPVVRFIVRAVDDVLKKEFGLAQGLADTSKIDIDVQVQNQKKKKLSVHKVQVLDPATGTGTFLNEVILHLKKTFEGQEGRWSQYVNDDLLPRLHGFELMMASYTIAHLKLSSTIAETGAKIENTRLGVYLTNSLEKGETGENTLFSSLGFGKALTEESNQANRVKNELPIMVVMGNPPYSVSSSNKGEWIQNLIKDYKKDLNERKINLDDDYIKFIRFAENLIEQNGSGVVAMITNNSFIDGITHRQMRKHLLETFDSIYIVDLHGNSKKKETAPGGGKDENVFDIQQGVSINIFIKKQGKKKSFGEVYHNSFFGERENKFNTLHNASMESIVWSKLKCVEPHYFFVPKDFGVSEEYENGFKLDELFREFNSGIQTKRDKLVYRFDRKEIEGVISDFSTLDSAELKRKYSLPADGRDWTVSTSQKDVRDSEGAYVPVLYHPWDIRQTWYSGKTKGIMAYPRAPLMRVMLKENTALIVVRNSRRGNVNNVFVSDTILDKDAISPFDNSRFLPLYLHAEDGSKVPNLKKEIVDGIENVVGKVSPEEIFDFTYAILHSPSYREKYKEFLKIDFPRVPYPKDTGSFRNLVVLGSELRLLHLLKSPKLGQLVTTYPVGGSNIVEKISYKDGNVYINTEQYFGGVTESAWNFYIGGYQPAQKWLKDRKGRMLSNADIEHYQKMIVAMVETERVMGEIDKIM